MVIVYAEAGTASPAPAHCRGAQPSTGAVRLFRLIRERVCGSDPNIAFALAGLRSATEKL